MNDIMSQTKIEYKRESGRVVLFYVDGKTPIHQRTNERTNYKYKLHTKSNQTQCSKKIQNKKTKEQKKNEHKPTTKVNEKAGEKSYVHYHEFGWQLLF